MLTAIVISFGMTALLVVLALRGYLETGRTMSTAHSEVPERRGPAAHEPLAHRPGSPAGAGGAAPCFSGGAPNLQRRCPWPRPRSCALPAIGLYMLAADGVRRPTARQLAGAVRHRPGARPAVRAHAAAHRRARRRRRCSMPPRLGRARPPFPSRCSSSSSWASTAPFSPATCSTCSCSSRSC